MGAGASAVGMPIEQRRELYEDLRTKYTKDDLDALAEEEKQAWLEVHDEQREADASVTVTEALTNVEVAEEVVPTRAVAAEAASDEGIAGTGRGEDDAEDGTSAIGAAAPLSSGQRDLSITAPEVTVRQAAEAAAALTGASTGRKSGWDLSGERETGVRPQEKSTRLSFLLASEDKDDGDDGSGDAGCVGDSWEGGGGGASVTGEGADGASDGKGRQQQQPPARSSRGSVELPAWKKAAEELETPNELCIGDVVRARDKEFNGMWFEGVLTAIHDETTFEVELSNDEEEGTEGGSPQRITVGIEDVVRVMPWFCIEVGDMVECQPEGTMGWIRGTVVNIALDKAMYDVALESVRNCLIPHAGFEDECDELHEACEGVANINDGENRDSITRKEGGEVGNQRVYRVPDGSIRKIVSGRQAASRRWKKVYLASCLTSNIGRLISGKDASSGAEE